MILRKDSAGTRCLVPAFASRTVFVFFKSVPSPGIASWTGLLTVGSEENVNVFECAFTRDRTWDRLLKRELLYQLSYEGIYI